MSHAFFVASLSSLRILWLALPLSLLLASAGFTAPDAAQAQPPGRPVGRISMEVGQGGFILSAMGGKGTLTFKGRTYAFKVGGLGVGAVGVSKVSAVGEVYGLKRLEDFPGGYVQAQAGYTAVDGKGVHWLENSNGVVLKLRSRSKGLSLNFGADGLKIEMGPIRKSKPRG